MTGSTFKLMNGASLSASVSSDTVDLLNFDGYSVQVIMTGSPVGTLKIQGTNDGTNFEDIPDTSFAVTTSGGVLYNCVEQQYNRFKVVYTRASGSGTLDCYVTLKD